MTKDQIRTNMKIQRNLLTEEEQNCLSTSIRNRLLQSDIYSNCKSLFTFLSIKSEVDTWEIIHQAFMDLKRVYLPMVEGMNMEFYEVHDLDNLQQGKFGLLEPPIYEINRYNKEINLLKKETIEINITCNKAPVLPITENVIDKFHELPIAENIINKAPEYPITENVINKLPKFPISKDLILLPGLAFDVSGNRIGYGAGYYDSYLLAQGEEHFYKIALAYDFQVLEHIASEPYDIKVDEILTPTRRIQCKETNKAV